MASSQGEIPKVQEDRGWFLQVFGEFKLSDPSGKAICVPTRKVEGLVVIVVLAGPGGISRSRLQQELWPNRPLRSQQNSLRQAIVLAKQHLGSDFMTSTRDRCVIGANIRIKTDAETASKRLQSNLPEFMPELEGDWFNKKRIEYSRGFAQPETVVKEPQIQVETPIKAFSDLLLWYSIRDPQKALGLYRDHLDVASGLTPLEAEAVCNNCMNRIPESSSVYGWYLYLRGGLELSYVNVANSHKYLSSAIKLGRDQKDVELIIESSVLQSIGMIVTGNAPSALILANEIDQFCQLSSDPVLRSRGKIMRAAAHIHLDRVEQGIQEIKDAVPFLENAPIESSVHYTLMALYYATNDQPVEARKILQKLEDEGMDLNHNRLRLLYQMTESLIALKEDNFDLARTNFTKLTVDASKSKSKHFEIYGKEGYAVAVWKQREKELAAKSLQESHSIRKEMKMVYTSWDKLRLTGIPFK